MGLQWIYGKTELEDGEIPFGNLKFSKKINKGAFGEVWEGTYNMKRVAIKKSHHMPKSVFKDCEVGPYNEDMKKIIINEIKKFLKLEHENIVDFFGFSKILVENDVVFYIVMEYMELGSLEDFLKKSGSILTDDDKLILIMGIIESMCYIKKKKVIHRDIKPDNILIFKKNQQYHCKLTDFGGARNLATVQNAKAIYSPLYTAPELYNNENPPFSYQSDIYALGLVLLNILGGGEYKIKAEIPIKTFPKVDSVELKDVLEIAKSLCSVDPSKRLTIENVRKEFYSILSEEFTKKIFYEYWKKDFIINFDYCFYLSNVIFMKRYSKELNYDGNKEKITKLMKKCKGDLDEFLDVSWLSNLTKTHSIFDEVIEILEKLSKESLTQLYRILKSNNGFDSRVKVVRLKNNSIEQIRECLTGFMFKFIDFVDKDFVFHSPITKDIFLVSGNLELFRKCYQKNKKINYQKFKAEDFLSCAKLGMMFRYKGDFPRSKENFEKSIKLNPNFEYSYNGLGIVYRNLKNYPKAIEFYEKSIKLNPNFEYPYNGLGNVYNNLKDYPKAIEFYEKSIKLNPNNEYPYCNLGVVFRKLKDYPKAIECYEKAIKINPKYSLPYYNLHLIYKLTNQPKKSEENYKKYQELEKK